MADVLAGFAVVWLIIGVGYVMGRFRVLGPEARIVMSRTAFFVASPCLLFITISGSPIGEVIGPQFGVAASSAFLTVISFLLLARFALRERRRSERLIAAQSAGMVNGANLGFPIAAYVLGDVALAAPVVMFQLALFMPIMVAALDQTTVTESAGTSVRPSARRTALRRVGQTVGNPVIVGSLLGLLFSWQRWSFPGPIQEAISVLAGAAIPLLLLSFGLSLVGSRPLEKAAGRRRDVLLASAVKLLVHPGFAYLIAVFVFRLDGVMLLAAVVMASLPTAQNVLVTAVRYRSGEVIARDTVLLTTILGIPTVAVVALLLA